MRARLAVERRVCTRPAELVSGQLETDHGGYVKVTRGTTATNVPGVFAAGDVTDGSFGTCGGLRYIDDFRRALPPYLKAIAILRRGIVQRSSREKHPIRWGTRWLTD